MEARAQENILRLFSLLRRPKASQFMWRRGDKSLKAQIKWPGRSVMYNVCVRPGTTLALAKSQLFFLSWLDRDVYSIRIWHWMGTFLMWWKYGTFTMYASQYLILRLQTCIKLGCVLIFIFTVMNGCAHLVSSLIIKNKSNRLDWVKGEYYEICRNKTRSKLCTLTAIWPRLCIVRILSYFSRGDDGPRKSS